MIYPPGNVGFGKIQIGNLNWGLFCFIDSPLYFNGGRRGIYFEGEGAQNSVLNLLGNCKLSENLISLVLPLLFFAVISIMISSFQKWNFNSVNPSFVLLC